ncbi:unnamed protein product [Leuciscus chuanchicus]
MCMVPPLGDPHMCIPLLTTGSSDLRRALEDSRGGVIRLEPQSSSSDVTRSDHERERLGYGCNPRSLSGNGDVTSSCHFRCTAEKRLGPVSAPQRRHICIVPAYFLIYPLRRAELRYANSADPWHFIAIGSFYILEGFQRDRNSPAQKGDDLDDQETAPAPPRASSDWSTRKSLLSDMWEKERPCLVNTMVAQQNATTQICQQCGSPAAVRCRDCRPQPFFCADCDVSIHRNHVFHNRDATIAGFFQPLPPTTCVVERALSQCVCILPLEMPEKICSCATGSLSVNTGKVVAVVTMNGRYDLSMPEMKCEACKATWSAGVDDLVRNDYWPATLHFSTVYATDVFCSYEELKMAAPGLSCQAFLRMLDQRTVRFGRTGKITADSFRKSFLEWEAVRFEVEKIYMLAVSVDGNRKHYRFKNAARSEEQALFKDIFIAKDEEVERFVDYIHSTTNHVSGRGVCGGEWSAARETSSRSSSKIDEEGLELAVCRHGVFLGALNMFRGEIFAYPLYLQNKLANKPISFFAIDVTCKYWPYLNKVAKSCPELQHLLGMKPFLSVFHAKAHDFKCEVKWSGAYQQGAGLTLGEEVEQCNAFLSRIAVTTKHMSKAGRTDMLTLMAMRWNQQKFKNFRPKPIRSQCLDLESMRTQLAVTQVEVEGWVTDIKEWAEVKCLHFFSSQQQQNADLDAVTSRMEVLVASIKRRSQRLYKGTDGSKGRARIRRKIREEKAILSSVVEKYNSMVPDTERIVFDNILSDETVWPWQLSHGDTVDLKTKRKAFDVVMAIRRLEEEKKIVLSEMAKHWKSLSTRADTLKEMSCQLSSEALKSVLVVTVQLCQLKLKIDAVEKLLSTVWAITSKRNGTSLQVLCIQELCFLVLGISGPESACCPAVLCCLEDTAGVSRQ